MSVPINPKRTPRNQGRVQFLAARKRIQALLEAGYDWKSIHAELAANGGLTIGYSVFCDYMNKENDGRLMIPAKGKERLSAAEGSKAGRGLFKPERPERFGAFSLDSNKSLEDLA